MASAEVAVRIADAPEVAALIEAAAALVPWLEWPMPLSSEPRCVICGCRPAVGHVWRCPARQLAVAVEPFRRAGDKG